MSSYPGWFDPHKALPPKAQELVESGRIVLQDEPSLQQLIEEATDFHTDQLSRYREQIADIRARYVWLRAYLSDGAVPASALDELQRVRDWLRTYLSDHGALPRP